MCRRAQPCEGIRKAAENAGRMIVLGIDPGTASTGYGVVAQRGGRLLALDGGVIETPAGRPLERRLADDPRARRATCSRSTSPTPSRSRTSTSAPTRAPRSRSARRAASSCSPPASAGSLRAPTRRSRSRARSAAPAAPTKDQVQRMVQRAARAARAAAARPRRRRARRRHLPPQPRAARAARRRSRAMIALVRGEVAVRRPDHVVVDCGGVGYRLAVSAETLRHVPAVGKPVTLHAHLDRARRRAAALRLRHRGGARPLPDAARRAVRGAEGRARRPLAAAPPRELIAALAAGDAARFQAVPGIGKRTAERIIVELREKVGDVPDGDRHRGRAAATTRACSPATACVGLGFSLAGGRGAARRRRRRTATEDAHRPAPCKAARP